MKTITSTIVALAFAGLSFAQAPAPASKTPAATDSTAPTAKKHVKKHKKTATTTTQATPAPAAK